MATIIDGKTLALRLREAIAGEVTHLVERGVAPGLAVVLVGSDPASQVYVRTKRTACAKAGIAAFDHDLPETASEPQLLALIARLNADPHVHGILVQLPLPGHIDEQRVIESIDPAKDVDGFHPINIGRLVVDAPCFAPCTPAGCLALIDSTGVDLSGQRAVIVGRSAIVGKPMALMLLARNATVTICHSQTRDLEEEIARADVVIAAAGRARMISGAWIKPGAIVIDVGINRLPDGSLVGDVDFDRAHERAAFITPVPGGVGPMTIAMLLRNTVEAARRLRSDSPIVRRFDSPTVRR